VKAELKTIYNLPFGLLMTLGNDVTLHNPRIILALLLSSCGRSENRVEVLDGLFEHGMDSREREDLGNQDRDNTHPGQEQCSPRGE